MTEKISLDDYDELDAYTKEQMFKIAEELNDLQLKYDTRLLAALLAGRSAMLHANLVSAKILTQDDAKKIWAQAGDVIDDLPDREVKVVKMMDDEIIDPVQIN